MTRYAMVLDLTVCTGCRACEAACAMENQTPYWADKSRTRVEDVIRGEFPDVTRTFLPHLCMHCDDAPCVEVCPTGASYVGAGGAVLIDHDKCVLCGYCLAACPYEQRYQYTAEDLAQAPHYFGETPMREASMDKCNFCIHRVEKGMEPACVATCLAGARIFGDLDDPESEVAKLVASGRAQPLAPEAGTKPKVFYIAETEEDMTMLPVSLASAGLTHIHTGAQLLGSAALGLVAVGALGVFGYARGNARKHLAEIAVQNDPTLLEDAAKEKEAQT